MADERCLQQLRCSLRYALRERLLQQAVDCCSRGILYGSYPGLFEFWSAIVLAMDGRLSDALGKLRQLEKHGKDYNERAGSQSQSAECLPSFQLPTEILSMLVTSSVFKELNAAETDLKSKGLAFLTCQMSSEALLVAADAFTQIGNLKAAQDILEVYKNNL